jgi:tRNA 5-methylaminomethyl-2-thiouridine biosynthesis bifunctional protein
VRIAIDRDGAAGDVTGLLRLDAGADVAAMRLMLERLGLPSDYVQALDASEASAVAGVALDAPAWFYPSGGWVDPAALARSFLRRAGDLATTRVDADVRALKRTDDGWQLLDAEGRVLAASQTVVLANAVDSLRLLGTPDWPVESIRGQLSMARDAGLLASLPTIPIAGSGYLLPELGGRAIFGATSQPGDTDPSVRVQDHVTNLAALARLLGRQVDATPSELDGRTAWRFSSRDRLPIIGSVPDGLAVKDGARLDQPRFVPRLPGLYVFTALGSRGITWSALGARILASQISGSPSPVEASLLDAVDPARYPIRLARRAGEVGAGAPSQPRSTA